jgi:ubiquinone/menaquinone biosynthesis C-methylase UbiE
MAAMTPLPRNHWEDMARKWARVKPPLRPNAEVAAAVKAELAPLGGPTLLLGVTPELATIAAPLIGIDRNPGMIACAWPGNAPGRHAVQGDWLAMPVAGDSIANAIGDGSFNTLAYPDGYVRLFDQLARVLKPGGRVIVRNFTTPVAGDTLAAVRAATLARRIVSLHAFKWHLAMAVVAQSESPNIRVTQIRDSFHEIFPDQAELMTATGWTEDEIDTIEVYKGSIVSFSFPTLPQFQQVLPAGFGAMRVLSSGSYEMADRCPIIVMNRE